MPSCTLKAPSRRVMLMGASALLLSLLPGGHSDAAEPEKVSLRISAGNAPATLAEFVRQTGLQVLFDFDAVRHSITREVEGDLDAREALALMFEGSELTFEFINTRTVAIRRRPQAPTMVAQPNPGS